MPDFGQLILDNWEVIKANWKLFVIFGLFCLSLCAGVLKVFYDNILYKDLPEKRELQAEIKGLQAQIQDLTEQNRALAEENRLFRENDRFLKGASVPDQTSSLGEKISASLSE